MAKKGVWLEWGQIKERYQVRQLPRNGFPFQPLTLLYAANTYEASAVC